MNALSGFVVFTLAVEMIASALYTELLTGPIWSTAFYAIMAGWCNWRASFVAKRIKMSASSAVFILIMGISVLVSTAMTMITGMTALVVSYDAHSNSLAAFYSLSYNIYSYTAIALTISELLSLLANKIIRRGSGVEHFIYTAVRSVSVVSCCPVHKGAKGVQS